ncbi:MAG: Unknown protein [uncultured Sulfurovum sp.]|uniref:Uncharacterized protein n=1 Tax=uncultured Sulfurovum sp. TaxID=269237 RepID=A0A6S6T5P8_9BACT|nr:MAG: Unknown protein [uncultured Sulfurovum sp.]
MQLSDIVEKYSLRTISETTNISENNLEYMIAEDFSNLTRPKALGFISIIEREYDIDLKPLKKTAIAYYETNKSSTASVSVGLPLEDKKKGNSKWFFFVIFALFAYASWYFFSQFSQNTLGNMLSFNESNQSNELHLDTNVSSDEQNKTTNTEKESDENDGLSIKSVLRSVGIDSTDDEDVDINEKETTTTFNTEIIEENNVIVVGSSANEPSEVNTVTSNDDTVVANATNTTIVTDKKVDATVTPKPSPTATTTPTPEVKVTASPKTVTPKKTKKVVLKPKRRLWFGMVNMSTKKRDHFSISDQYEIDVSNNKRWLIATSAAAFSMKYNDETKTYNNGREHYFKVTQDGITPLSKREYVKQGGWRKW